MIALGGVALLALAPASAQETISYTYDAQGRLISVNRGSTGPNAGVSSTYTYDDADNRTNVTVTVPGPPAFAINNVSATEGTALVFTVTRSGSTAGTDTVQYATADGTATVGSDYNAVALTTLTFSPGQATKSVSVTTIDDSLVESSETVNVNLSNASAGSSIVDSLGVGTINDNDSATPCNGVSFAASNNPAANEGASLSFTITKTGTTGDTCSLKYQTADGTAKAGTNYTAKALTTLSFGAAAASKTVLVTTLDDGVVTGNLAMYLNLSAPSGAATISDNQATGTIRNVDTAPSTCSGVSFSVNSVSADEGVPLNFTITKTGSTTATCSVTYATADGTALAGINYAAIGATSASFAAATTSVQVQVTTYDDGVYRAANRYMYLNLSAPSSGATLTNTQGTGTLFEVDPQNICPTSPTGTSTTPSTTPPGTTDTSATNSPDTTSGTTSPDSSVQPTQPIC
jgi:hypothetical protein